jgi:hypothetical protein
MIDNPTAGDEGESRIAERLRALYDHTPVPTPELRARIDAVLARGAADGARAERARRGGIRIGIAAMLLLSAGVIVSRRRATTGVADREVPFVLSAPAARTVSLVGSFNHWNAGATPMHSNPATGRWTAELRLGPGRHVYAYVLDGVTWVVDPLAPRAADQDYGPINTLLVAADRQ